MEGELCPQNVPQPVRRAESPSEPQRARTGGHAALFVAAVVPLAVGLCVRFGTHPARGAAPPVVMASAGPVLPRAAPPVVPVDDGADRLYRPREAELVPLAFEAPPEERAYAPIPAAPESLPAPPGAEPRRTPRLRALPSLSGFGVGPREARPEPAVAGSAGIEAPMAALARANCPGCREAAEGIAFDPGKVTRQGAPLPKGMLFLSGECEGGWIYGLRNNEGFPIRITMTSDSGEVWGFEALKPGETGYLKATRPIRAMNAGIDALP